LKNLTKAAQAKPRDLQNSRLLQGLPRLKPALPVEHAATRFTTFPIGEFRKSLEAACATQEDRGSV